MSSTPGPAMEFLGRVAFELDRMRPLVPTYIHLLVSAVFPIYTAAHASLARPPSAAPSSTKKDLDVTDLQDEEISPTIETLTPSDAILFPVLAGMTLASLYFVLKWLQDPTLLNYYLGLYFAIIGLYFCIKFVRDGLSLVRSILLPNQYSHQGKLWKLASDENHFTAAGHEDNTAIRKSPLPGCMSAIFGRQNTAAWSCRKFVYTKLRLKLNVRNLFNITTYIDTLDLVGLIIAAPLVYYHTFIGKPWFLTNFMGFSFCYGSLQITTPGTSWTGTLLLIALFLYDIYFVFFTPMMVTVATKLDVPIKLLFPRPDGCVKPHGAMPGSQEMEEYLQCLAKKRTMAMLGLGDIVIPGMMLAFALRFDLYLFYRKLADARENTTIDEMQTGKKVPYLPATGSWGERLWTALKLQSPELQAKRFPKTYFNASVVGYISGMIVTMVVMQVSEHAQPALLYLVPGVLISLWGVALARGDFEKLWHYSEVPEELKNNKGDSNDTEESQKRISAGEDKIQDIGDVADRSKEQNGDDLKDVQPKDGETPNEQVSKKTKTTEENDEIHLVFFSLSTLRPGKRKPQQEYPNMEEEDAEEEGQETNNVSTIAPIPLAAPESKPDSSHKQENQTRNDEPAIKRRRKA